MSEPVPMVYMYNGRFVDLLSREDLLELVKVLMQEQDRMRQRELSAIRMVSVVAEALK